MYLECRYIANTPTKMCHPQSEIKHSRLSCYLIWLLTTTSPRQTKFESVRRFISI